MQVTDSGQYLEFDVMATDTPNNILFAESNIYITYSSVFGTNLVSSGAVTASKGMAIDSPYYNVIVSDTLPSMLKLSVTHTINPTSLTNLDSVNQQLCHLKVRLSSYISGGVAFDSSLMSGQSFYQRTPAGLATPYDLVMVSGVEAPQSTFLGFNISNIVLMPSTNPTQLSFDILGTTNVTDPIADYVVAIAFNQYAINNDSVGSYLDDGDDGLGNPIYTFSYSLSSGSLIVSFKADTEYYDASNQDQSDYTIGNFTNLAHVVLYINDCDNLPMVAIDPSNSSANYGDASTNIFIPFGSVDTSFQASFNNDGTRMCILPPHVFNWSPACTNAGSFEVTTINGQHFGDSTGTVYFNSADSPGILFPTHPQDIISWSDDQIQLLIPSQPYAGQIAASGQFYVATAGDSMDSYAENSQMSIGYANLNLRSGGAALFVYYPDTSFTFQMDSALFYNPGAVSTISNVLSDINCRSGLFFQLNTSTPAAIDSPIDNDGIHLICLKPSSSGIFPTGTLAVTLLKNRIEPCSNGLSAYNNLGGYITDVDMVIRSDVSWNWSQDTLPSATQDDFGTSMLHEFGHAAGLCHTLPSSSGNVMYANQSLQEKIPDYSNDPDDILGIINMLSAGHTIGLSSGGCAPGKHSFYVCPTHETPSGCVTRTATTNGINDIEGVPNGFTASLYPNPYEGTTVIHIDVSEYTEFNIAVYDMLGQVVRQTGIAGSGSFDVPLSDFNESMGMYLIAVSDTHTRLVLKMIKL